MKRSIVIIAVILIPLLPVPGFSIEVSVTAVGDIYMGGKAEPYIKNLGPDYPFELTKDILREGDVTVGNLEAPLTTSDEVFVDKAFILRSWPGVVRGLKNAGFNVLTLANNHIMDYGHRGLADTIKNLDSLEISHAGAGSNLEEARRPAELKVKGVKVLVLAYSNTLPGGFYAGDNTPGTATGLAKYVKEDVRLAAKKADIVIVSFHWGAERWIYPKDYQRVLAHIAIDSGALLVIGHHPHVVQGIEAYKGGLIFYSLGNFVFGSYSLYEAGGMIAKVVFDSDILDDGPEYFIKSAQVIPLEVDNRVVRFRPAPRNVFELWRSVSEIEAISTPFNLMLRPGGMRGHIALYCP